ncbi:hypothetical protein DTL21_04475 [Bremerella cremea]|uniref:Uncharacterized protein n=1 Tax=Blastopirellula marina TaxID=124 RepID=A0A2S8FYE8_9BACT|nr:MULTISPECIES: hypothetical protein [Pirellulaceae]PQO37208.1 hypothetical protein C5Y83_04475 [Blastopirellula marina]RCS49595.1 hypothetical protein DTL21_04475 [Bremerella cremea]
MVHKSLDYTKDELSTWERVKKAFANDWEQTKADFGIEGNRDMDQDVDDTVKQMAGSDDAFENREQAFRFGYIAQHRYQSKYPKWNNELDERLRSEYDGDYDTDRPYVRHAYGYHGGI